MVESNTPVMIASFRANIIKHNCANKAIFPLKQAGSTLILVYRRLEGTELGIVTVYMEICATFDRSAEFEFLQYLWSPDKVTVRCSNLHRNWLLGIAVAVII
ncbi:hypothetical protein RB2150_00250 [Rhodobacterales bacterium HTCC2150]|nr:hypothetical protein RB2150_00250 [Rhodobacterales bacterium HTCC2150] [Rhodobacteraceae bacterium HTCC2150]